MLAALLLRALGAPVEGEPTDSPAGDSSGEEELVPSDLLSASPVWDLIIGATAGHQKEFEDEFPQGVKYHFLENYKVSSLPAKCPSSNFSMEACLRRLAEGLHTYMVLLEHVEREYPGSSILLHAKYYSRQLVDLIKKKMKSPGQVTVLTSSQEEQLVQDINNPDSFHRRMTGHSILQQLHDFLREAKLAIRKREKSRQMRKGSNMIIAAIHPSFQILQR
ncbi:interleukin-6-like [Scophthalmus maximus]|nr:interleukin-6-like [Scophthalmus maximus]